MKIILTDTCAICNNIKNKKELACNKCYEEEKQILLKKINMRVKTELRRKIDRAQAIKYNIGDLIQVRSADGKTIKYGIVIGRHDRYCDVVCDEHAGKLGYAHSFFARHVSLVLAAKDFNSEKATKILPGILFLQPNIINVANCVFAINKPIINPLTLF